MRLSWSNIFIRWLIIAGPAACRPLSARETESLFILGYTDTLYSKRIGEERPVFFSLPVDYHQSGRSCPVLNILDGGQPCSGRSGGTPSVSPIIVNEKETS